MAKKKKVQDTSPLAMGRQQKGSAANKRVQKAGTNTKSQSSVSQKDRINQKNYGTTTPNVRRTTAPTSRSTASNNRAEQRLVQPTARKTTNAPTSASMNRQKQQQNRPPATAAEMRRQNAQNQKSTAGITREQQEKTKQRFSTAKEMMNQRAEEGRKQKMGAEATAEQKAAARRAVKNTPALVKKAAIDAGEGHLKTIADITEMTASSKKGVQAKAMKMGIQDDPRQMRWLEKERAETAKQAKAERERLQKKQDKRQAEWDEKTKNAKGLEKAYYGAVESGVGMATDMVIGLGTPGASLAAMGSRTYGSTRGQAQKEGATEKEDRLYSLLQAGKEVGTELMFPGAGLAKKAYGKAGIPLAEKAANRLIKGLSGRAADVTHAGLRLAGGMAEENIEEIAGWGLDPLIKEFTYGKNVRKREAQEVMNRISEDMRSKIADENDAASASAYLSSDTFLEDTKKDYMEEGLSEKEAEVVANKMRDFLTASLTGDTETMESLEDEISKDVAKAHNILEDYSGKELLETIASTSLLTGVTGLPGSVTSSMKGAALRDELGEKGIRALAKTAIDFEDETDSYKGQAARDRLDSGKELTSTQVYELAEATQKQIEKDSRRQEASVDNASKQIRSENLVSPYGVDARGEMVLDETTDKNYESSAKAAETTIKNFVNNSEEKESLTDTEIRDGSRAIAGFKTGVFTLDDANELNYSNTAVREAFKEETGIDLNQYVVKDKDGKVNIPKTNAATKDALFAMASDNLVESAREATVNWMDNVKGEVVSQVTARMGAQGSLALQSALDDVDERNRSEYMMVANASDMLYQSALNLGIEWDSVKAEATKMFPNISENKLQAMYEAGLADRDMATDKYRGKSVRLGESLANLKDSDRANVTGQVFVDTEIPLKGTVVRAFTEVATNLGVDIHLVDNLPTDSGQQANGMYDKGTIYINANSSFEQNMGYIFMHEVTHHLKEYAPEEYAALERLVREKWFAYDDAQMQNEIAKRIDLYNRATEGKQTLTEAEALEEIIADAAHEFINDPNFANQVAEENPNLAKAVLNSIRNALRMLRRVLATGSIDDETHMNDLFSQLDIFDEAERLWLNAYTAAYQNKAALAIDNWQDDVNAQSDTRESLSLSDNKKRNSASAKYERGEKLTHKQFNSYYSAHKLNLRGQNNIQEQIDDIKANGFKSATSLSNVVPAGINDYVDPERPNYTEGLYGAREGDTVLLVPKNYLDQKNDRIISGFQPRDYEIVTVERDFQPYYELYEKAYDESGERYSLSDSNLTVQGNTARWTDSRIDSLIREYGASDEKYSKAWAVMMRPEDFLKLTINDETLDAWRNAENETRPLDEEQLAWEGQTPFLIIDANAEDDSSYRIDGHEGRHRMLALMEAGIKSVPVALQETRVTKYSKTKIPNLTLAAQDFTGEGGVNNDARVEISDLVPIKESNRDELIEKFGGEADIRFSLSSPVERVKDLVAVHNVKISDLPNMLELGGMPMPSIAITKASMGHDKYGDISFLFHSNTIDPAMSRYNKVYGGDAYTPTFPAVRYKTNSEVSNELSNLYYDNYREHGGDTLRGLYRYAEGLEDELNSAGGEAALIEKAKGDTSLMQSYLAIQGKDKVEDVYKTEATTLTDAQVEMHELFIKELGEDAIRDVKTPEGENPIAHRKEWFKKHEKEIETAYTKWLKESAGLDDEIIKKILNDETTASYVKLFRETLKYLQDGATTTKEIYDGEATRAAITKAANEAGFESWVDETFKGVEVGKGIRNDKDMFTNMGNRRSWDTLHDPVTLENVVGIMRSEMDTGSNGFLGANPKGAAQKSYNSLDEIIADEDRLEMLTDEEYSERSDEALTLFTDVCASIVESNPKRFENSFGAILDVGEYVAEVLNETRNKDKMHKLLNRDYGMTVSDEQMDRLWEAIQAISEVPTGYFEAKPKRGVGFDEVKAALVPKDMDKGLTQQLSDRGIEIVEYNPEVEGDRTAKLNEVADRQDIKFSLSSDSEGNNLTTNQSLFFNKSKARDEQGRLLRLYHGTQNGGFTIFDPSYGISSRAFFFTNSLASAKGYSGTDAEFTPDMAGEEDIRVNYPVYLDMQNPLIVDAEGHAWVDIPFDGDYVSSNWLVEYAQSEGYDSVIIKNVIDRGSADTALTSQDDYIVFNSNQVKDVNNLNPTENPDIRFSITPEDEAKSKMAYEYAMDDSYEALEYYEQRLADLTDEAAENRPIKTFSEEKISEFYAGLRSTDSWVHTDPIDEEDAVRMANSKKDFFANLNAKWNDRWRTEGEVLDVKSVKKDVRNLVMGVMQNSDTNSKYKNDLVKKTLFDVRTAFQLMKQDRPEVASELLYYSAQRMIDNVQFYVDGTFDQYKELKHYLRTTKISLGEEYWSDVDYDAFRKRNYNRINLVKGKTNVDQVYQELEEMFPEFFNGEETMSVPDQLLQMEEVLDTVQPYKEAYSSDEAADLAFDIADDLYEIMVKGDEVRSLADTYKARYDAKTKAMKQRHAEAMLRVRKARDEGVQKERQKFREYKERQKEQKLHRKEFDSIQKSYNTLKDRLLSNTADSNIPEQYKKELAGLLAAFDLQTVRSKQLEKTKMRRSQKAIKMSAIRTALRQIEVRTQQFFHVNDAITDIIDELLGVNAEYPAAASIEGKTIDELSVEELIRIDKLLKALVHEFNTYKNVRIQDRNEKAQDIADAQVTSALEHAKKFGPGTDWHGIRGGIDKVLNMDEVTPAYMFRMVDRENKGLGMMWKELERSQDKYIRNTEQLSKWMQEITGKYHNKGRFGNKYGADEIAEWRRMRSVQDFNLTNGSISLTPAQMMSLAMLANRPQAYQHMIGAGVVVAPVNFQAKLETDLKRKTNRALPLVLTDADIKLIVSQLTPEQRKMAEDLQQLMANQMAEWGNEASMDVLGIRLFEEKDYFPIKSDRAALEKDLTADQFEQAIRNFGFTKAVMPGARNAIMIDDIFDVVTEHCNNMNLYNSYSKALNDFMKVYNKHTYQEDGSDYSVAQALGHAYSQKTTTFIMNFVKDLNGNVSRGRDTGIESMLQGQLANAKKASVFANIRVLLQQPTAITRAFAVINPKYLKGVKIEKGAMEEMFEHCPIAKWKSWGYYDINMGKNIEDIIMNEGNFLEDLATQAYGAADNVTWAAIWQMVKAEMKDTHPDVVEGSDEFWYQCNERMREIVDLTQVVDSPMHRSHAMRDKNFFVKSFTSFMAEPTLTFNMVRDGYIRAKEAWDSGNKKEAASIMSKTMSVYVLQAATVAAAAAIADAIRGKKPDGGGDDDEDKTFFASWWANTIENFKDEMKIWNKVYYIKDAAGIFEGWDNKLLAYQGIESFRDGYNQMTKKLSEGSKTSWWNIYQNLFGGIGYMLGIPVKTLMKDGRAVFEMLGGKLPEKLVGEEKSDAVVDKDSAFGRLIAPKDKSDSKSASAVKVSEEEHWYDYGNNPLSVKDGSALDNFLNHFGINLTGTEKAAAIQAQKDKEIAEKTEDISKSVADLDGEEKAKKTWSKVTTEMKDVEGRSVKELIAAGEFSTIDKYREMYIAAGNDADYFDSRIFAETKKSLKKSIAYEMTDDEMYAQQEQKAYLKMNGMTDAEISEIAYKSDVARDVKVAMMLGDEELVMEAVMPLVQAGITQEDFDKLWQNRNRIDLKKYNGRYKDKLKSTGNYVFPVDGVITSDFGHRSSPGGIGSTNHQGIDIGAAQGTPVAAADGGVVVMAGWYGGYGKTVQIRHDDGTITQYSHLSWWDVNEGDAVGQGQEIGLVGSTGNSTGPHLHLGVIKNDKYVDPKKYFNTYDKDWDTSA